MRSAWPINLPVLDLRSECTSTYSAAHLIWELARICNPLDFTPGSKSLNPLKYFQVYNCIVTVLYEVHLPFPLIPFLLGGKCVCTISLLQQCIASVSFILQNIFNQFPSPWPVPWALCIQFSCNGTWCFSVEIFREYSLDYRLSTFPQPLQLTSFVTQTLPHFILNIHEKKHKSERNNKVCACLTCNSL